QNEFSSSGAADLISSLQQSGSIFNLQLDISENNIGVEGANKLGQALSKYLQLKSLSISVRENKIGAQGVTSLVTSFIHLKSLTYLNMDLSYNNIGKKGMSGISPIIAKLEQLNVLSINLMKNNIQDEDILNLAAALSKIANLQSLNLDLKFNKVGFQKVQNLIKEVSKCPHISSLAISLKKHINKQQQARLDIKTKIVFQNNKQEFNCKVNKYIFQINKEHNSQMSYLKSIKKSTQGVQKQHDKENSLSYHLPQKSQAKNVKSIDISLNVLETNKAQNSSNVQQSQKDLNSKLQSLIQKGQVLEDKKQNNQLDQKTLDNIESPKNSTQFNTSRESFFVSLYNKAKEFSDHKQQLKFQEDQKELKECVFAPQINRNNSENKRTLENFLEDQKKFEINKKNKQSQLKQLVSQEETKELTLKPKINEARSPVGRDKSVPIHERLYNLKDLKKNQASLNKLNDIVGGSNNDKSYQSPKQMQVNHTNASISLEESSMFSPRINSKSKSLKRKDHISVILYNDAQRRNQQSRRNSQQERSLSSYNNKNSSISSCSITLNERSEQVYTYSFVKLFQNVWNQVVPQSDTSDQTPAHQNQNIQRVDYLRMNQILELLLFITPSSQINNQTKLTNPNLAKERSLVYDIWCNLRGDKFRGVSKRNFGLFLLYLQGIKNPTVLEEFAQIFPSSCKNIQNLKQQSSIFNFESAAEISEKTSPKNFTPISSNIRKISQISIVNSDGNSVITNRITNIEEDGNNQNQTKFLNQDLKFQEAMNKFQEKAARTEQQFEQKKVYGYFEGENWYVGEDQCSIQFKYDLLIKNRLNQQQIGNLSQRTIMEQKKANQPQKKKNTTYLSGKIISIDLKKPLTPNQHVDLLVKQRNMQMKRHEDMKKVQSEKELEECTFQPNIERNKEKLSNTSIGMQSSLNLYKTMFKTSSQKRDKSTYDVEYEKQCDECTFTPDISLTTKNFQKQKQSIDQSSIVNRKDFVTSVERIKQGRQISQNNSLMFQRGYHDLPNFQMISYVSNTSDKQKQSFFSTQGPFRTFDAFVMQAFQFKSKEKVLRIQPYEDQRKKFVQFQQKQLQQQAATIPFSKPQLPSNLEESNILQFSFNPQLRVVRFSQNLIQQPLQLSKKISVVQSTQDTRQMNRESIVVKDLFNFQQSRLSKELHQSKIDQVLNLSIPLEVQSQLSFANLKDVNSSCQLKPNEKQQEVMIKKVKINQFFKNRPNSALADTDKDGRKKRENVTKSKMSNFICRSSSSSNERIRNKYCISPSRTERVLKQTQNQVEQHNNFVNQQIQNEKQKQEQRRLAKLLKKQESLDQQNNEQQQINQGDQQQVLQNNEGQIVQELQANSKEEQIHNNQDDTQPQNPSAPKIESDVSISSTVIKAKYKLKLNPKIRPMSPQEKSHFQNIKFLNTVNRPSSADQDDSLHTLKRIYTQSKKNQIQPDLTKQAVTTHDQAAQQKFREIYKKIDKSKEQISILNQEETALHSLLFKIDEKNRLPMKYGIAQQRKNSKKIDISYYNIGDQSVDIFCAGLSKLENLDTLNLKHNGFTEQGIQQVINCMEIDVKELDLSNNQVTEENINSILQKFVVDQYNLQILKLEKTGLGDSGVDILCTGLQYIKSLRILNLSQNCISNKSCYSIEDMILNLFNFRELYLYWNKIQGEGGALIIDACRENGRMKVLDLSHNQLGLSSNYDLFNNAFRKICEANNESSICHLDLSYNQFRIQDCLFLSKVIKKNTSIIGFHFAGHDCFITYQGFINQCYAKDLLYANNVPDLSKRIDGVKFKGYGEHRMMKECQEELPIRAGDNCWICEGWYEHTFEWTVNSGDLENIETIYLHLEIDGYTALRMNDESSNYGYFFLVRMVPPKCQIRYFFSLDGMTNIKIAKDQPMRFEEKGIIVNFTSKEIDHSRKSFILEDIINSQRDWEQRKEKIQIQLEASSKGTFNRKKLDDLSQFQKEEEKAIKKEMDNVQYKLLGNLIIFDKAIKKQKKLEIKTFNVIQTKKYFNIFSLKSAENLAQSTTKSKNLNQQQTSVQKSTNLNISVANLANQADLIYIPQIKLRPRIQLQGREQLQLAAQMWDFQQSLFKDFRMEDESLMKKCFEFDWECSKINQLIRDENDLQLVKEELRGIYVYIKNAYKYLAAIGTIIDVPCIQMNTFTDFINKTNIIDNLNLKLSDVDLKFVVTKTSTKIKRNPRNPEKGLIRYQFMEIIVRLAEDKYIRHKITNKYSQALLLLLNEGYLNALKRYQTSQSWRQSNLWNERCDFCFKYYNPIIKNVFNKYSDPLKKRQFMAFKYMTMEEFRSMCNDADLIGNRFTERDVNAIFNLSMMTQIDEIKYDRHYQMGMTELLEALSRLADRLFYEKLDSFIKEWKEKQQRGQQLKQQQQMQQSQAQQKQEEKAQKKKVKRKDSSVIFSDSDFDDEGSRMEFENTRGLFQGVQLHHKIESLLFVLYSQCVTDDFKEQFSFPTTTIFIESQKHKGSKPH
ncbi:hypothetical protein ABPG74_019342, partial [Tetrahymena malaccensis]